MNATPQQDSTHRTVLLETFSPAVVEAIDGRIRELSAEEASKLIKQNNDHVKELVAEQAANFRAAKDSGDPEAIADTNTATKAVQDATKAANKVTDDVNAGKPVEAEEVQATANKTDQAKEAVEKAKTTIEERLDKVERMSAPREGSDNSNRFEDIEAEVVSLRGRVDQVEACANEARNASAHAVATAYAALSGGGRLMRASRVALAVFGVVAILYFLIFVLTGLDWTLRDQFAWPFGLGAVAFWIAFVFGGDDEEAQASASAVGQADAGVGIVHSRERADDNQSPGASASADARASASR